jgi:tetratricopeptide (TPR) repeat protein
MRNFWAALLLAVGLISRAFGGYSEQFNAQLENNDFGAMEKTLRDWRQAAPGDDEWLVAAGNYFSLKAENKAPLLSRQEAAETPVVWCPPPAPGNDPPPKDPAYFDRALVAQAVTCWRAAIDSRPWRLDISFDLARLYQDQGDFDAQYGILIRALQYADKNRKKLKWTGDQELPQPRSHFIPSLIQEVISFYVAGGGPDNWDRVHRLCRLALTYYPNNPSAYNALAAYYSTREDWPHTMKYLLVACQKDPRDSLFLFNIGNTLARMGKGREARIYYRKVVRMNQYPDCVEVAGGYLGKPVKKNN